MIANNDDTPEEDRLLHIERSQRRIPMPPVNPNVPNHEHYWVDFYHGAGLSKKNKKILNVWMYCRKCLARAQIGLDVSDNDYEDDDD
jgi:hypothetical protein